MINVDYFSIKWTSLPEFLDFIPGKQNAFNMSILENAIQAKADKLSIDELNPILIKAPTASGKTMLLECLAKKAHILNPKLKIAFGQAAGLVKFFNEKKYSLKRIKELQEADIIFLDDTQAFANRIENQEDFVAFFDSLIKNDKLLILTFSSTRLDTLSPSMKTVINFEPAFLSRVSSGVIINLYPPDLDVRMRFAEQKALELKLHLTKSMYLLLARFSHDLRQLSGIIKTLSAYTKNAKKNLSEEELEIMLKGYTEEHYFTPELIIQQTALFYGIEVEDIRGKSRAANVVIARQVSMYLCRKLLGFSYANIAEIFGGKDHTTAIYACKKIEREQSLTPILNMLSHKITQSASPLSA